MSDDDLRNADRRMPSPPEKRDGGPTDQSNRDTRGDVRNGDAGAGRGDAGAGGPPKPGAGPGGDRPGLPKGDAGPGAGPKSDTGRSAPHGPNGGDSRVLSGGGQGRGSTELKNADARGMDSSRASSSDQNQSKGTSTEQNQSRAPGREQNQSRRPDAGPNRSEPNQSRAPGREENQSKKPADTAPNKTEQNQSQQPKQPREANYSKNPEQPNRSDGKNGVVFSHPMGHGQHGQGRGATGEGGHGLDKDPKTKDWATHAAKDLPAKVGTPVTAAHSGTVHVHHGKPEHTGKVYGDQVTITSDNGAVKTFYTHIDAKSGLTSGMHVNRGDEIGKVTDWKDSPNGTHLHFGSAVRTDDGSYRGVDPTPLLDKTQGSTQGRDVTVTGDGGYVIGDQRYGGSVSSPAPEQQSDSSSSSREQDRACTPR